MVGFNLQKHSVAILAYENKERYLSKNFLKTLESPLTHPSEEKLQKLKEISLDKIVKNN